MKITFVATSLLIPTLLLAADRLNVKTGLWEVITSTETHGTPPMPAEVLARMTPEQRAKMEAMFKSRETAGAHPHTRKSCVTEKDLEQPFRQDKENCTTTVVRSTATSQDINMTCTGEHPSTGTMHINTPTPESMNGTIEIRLEGKNDSLAIKTQLQGHWLGASCKKSETED